MNANMGINEYLTTHATWLNPGAGIEFKLRTPPLVCADGFTMSVQASTLHYSKPASDHGPYTHVEVGNPSATVPELAFYRNGGVYAFVPVGVVDAIIAQHGGIALVLDMEPHEDKRTQHAHRSPGGYGHGCGDSQSACRAGGCALGGHPPGTHGRKL